MNAAPPTQIRPKVALLSDPIVLAIFSAAQAGDVHKLESLRRHVHPDVWVANTVPGMSKEPVSLIDAAMYLGLDGVMKNEEQLESSDLTVLWLLERAQELGVLGAEHSNLSVDPHLLDRALLLLMRRSAVHLTAMGCFPKTVYLDLPPNLHGSSVPMDPNSGKILRPVGYLISELDVPNKPSLVAGLRRAIESAQVARQATAALVEIHSLQVELRPHKATVTANSAPL